MLQGLNYNFKVARNYPENLLWTNRLHLLQSLEFVVSVGRYRIDSDSCCLW